MPTRPTVAMVGMLGTLAAFASCSLATGLDDFVVGDRCDGAEDCPGEDNDCALKRCVEGACLFDVLPLGTPCPDGACDGTGACRSAVGDACLDANACASGFCVDGVCCDEACDEVCMSCAITEGTCTPVAVAGNDDSCEAPAVCDGAAACTSGQILWGATLPTLGVTSTAQSVALLDDGVLIAGYLGGATRFDEQPVNFGGVSYDPYTAKYDRAGNPVWINVIEEATEAIADAVVTIDDGTIVQAGRFLTSMTVSGQQVMGNNQYAIYVMAQDPGTGAHRWGRGFPGAGALGAAQPLDLTADGTDVLMGGYVQAPTDFGTGAIGAVGNLDAVLVRLDAITGATSFAAAYDSGFNDIIRGIAVDDDRNIVLVGDSNGSLDFGGEPLSSPLDTFHDPFVVKLTPDGDHLWSRSFVAAGGNAYARGVSIDAIGDVYVAGWHQATIVLDETTSLPRVGNPNDGFLAKLNGATGEVLWAFALGGANSYAHDVVIDAQGHAIVTGTAAGAPSYGSTTTHSAVGTTDAFVASFTADGDLLWVRTVGAAGGEQEGLDLVVDDLNIAVCGNFHTALTAAGTSFPTDGSWDPFVFTLSP